MSIYNFIRKSPSFKWYLHLFLAYVQTFFRNIKFIFLDKLHILLFKFLTLMKVLEFENEQLEHSHKCYLMQFKRFSSLSFGHLNKSISFQLGLFDNLLCKWVKKKKQNLHSTLCNLSLITSMLIALKMH